MSKKSQSSNDELNHCYQKITELPPCEIKYYLFLIIKIIESQPSKYGRFLCQLTSFVEDLNDICASDQVDSLKLTKLIQHHRQLTQVAKTSSLMKKVSTVLLHIIGSLGAIITGIIGGIIGGVVGFARGIYYHKMAHGFLAGLITGFALGAMFSFRLPKKVFKESATRQLKFALDGVHSCLDYLNAEKSKNNDEIKPFEHYRELMANAVLSECFKGDAEKFNTFLNANIPYQIRSFQAGFIGREMHHGFLGDHFFIKIDIVDKEYLIEYTQEPADTSETPSQVESRTATGKQLLDMLAMGEKLKESNPCNLQFVLSKMKPGDRDCYSYINYILYATNQPAMKLNRFANTNRVGKSIGFFIEKVSPFPPDFLEGDMSIENTALNR
jgi:hypothetical protein